MLRCISIILLCLISALSFSQSSMTEKSTDLGFSFGFNLPLADLQDRFGLMYGGDFSLNFYQGNIGSQFGFKFGFLTSDNVKEDPLAAFRTSGGEILTNTGAIANVTYRMAASYIGIDFKKTVFDIGEAETAKFYLGIGCGVMQHKIAFTDFSKTVPLVFDNYNKGLSRNSRGFYLEQQFGIKFRNGSKKFDLSMMFFEAFTKPVGLIEFDTMNDLQTQRLDVGAGLKLTWYISLTADQVGKDIYY